MLRRWLLRNNRSRFDLSAIFAIAVASLSGTYPIQFAIPFRDRRSLKLGFMNSSGNAFQPANDSFPIRTIRARTIELKRFPSQQTNLRVLAVLERKGSERLGRVKDVNLPFTTFLFAFVLLPNSSRLFSSSRLRNLEKR